MCLPTYPDDVPTLPNNSQVLPSSPEFGFNFENAFASDDEEEPFEDLTDEEEEESMPNNFASNTSNYFEQNWVESDSEEEDEYEYVLAPLSPPPSLPFYIPTCDELDHSLWIVPRPPLIQQESQHGYHSLLNFIDTLIHDTLNQEVTNQLELLGPPNPQ